MLEHETLPSWPQRPPTTVAELRDRFDRSSDLTVGVEEELMLADPRTLEPAAAIDRVLELAAGDPRFVRELKDDQVEIVTSVAGNAVAACLLLAQARLDLATLLQGEILLVGSGTFPAAGRPGEVTESSRYRQIAEEYASATLGSLPCGLHVHVALRGQTGLWPSTTPRAPTCPRSVRWPPTRRSSAGATRTSPPPGVR